MEVSADISLPAQDATQRERAKMRLYVLCQTCGWGLFMAIGVWETLAFPDHESKWSLGTTLAVSVMTFTTALLVTHFMRPLMERWRWKELGWKPLLPRLITMAFTAACIWNCFEILWVHGVLGLPWN